MLFDIIEIIIKSVLNGIIASIIVILFALLLGSFFGTLILILNLLAGEPVQWYLIVSPIYLFLGIGLWLTIADDY